MYIRHATLIAIAFCSIQGFVALGGEKFPAPLDRYEPAIQAFEMADKATPPKPGGIVIYGSSSARKWAQYQKDLGPYNIINRGFGGSTAVECAGYVERAVSPLKPDILIWYGGDNDVSAKGKPEDVIKSFQTMLEKLRKDVPAVKVIVVSIKPAPVRKPQFETLKQINKLFKDACENGKDMYYVDVWAPMLGADGQPVADLFLADRQHLTEKGYAIWNSLVKPVLEKLKPATK